MSVEGVLDKLRRSLNPPPRPDDTWELALLVRDVRALDASATVQVIASAVGCAAGMIAMLLIIGRYAMPEDVPTIRGLGVGAAWRLICEKYRWVNMEDVEGMKQG